MFASTGLAPVGRRPRPERAVVSWKLLVVSQDAQGGNPGCNHPGSDLHQPRGATGPRTVRARLRLHRPRAGGAGDLGQHPRRPRFPSSPPPALRRWGGRPRPDNRRARISLLRLHRPCAGGAGDLGQTTAAPAVSSPPRRRGGGDRSSTTRNDGQAGRPPYRAPAGASELRHRPRRWAAGANEIREVRHAGGTHRGCRPHGFHAGRFRPPHPFLLQSCSAAATTFFASGR